MRTRKPDNNFYVLDSNLLGKYISAPDNGEAYDDILKIAHVSDFYIHYCNINMRGGENEEDGVDINDSSKISFDNCNVKGGKKYAFTIKGGSNIIVLKDVVIHGKHRGDGVDIDIGNWSDSNTEKTTNVVLDNVTRADGRPVVVRVGRADPPIVKGGNVKIDRSKSFKLKLYWHLKRLLLKVGVTI